MASTLPGCQLQFSVLCITWPLPSALRFRYCYSHKHHSTVNLCICQCYSLGMCRMDISSSVSVLRKTAGSVRFQFGFELVSNARFLKFNLNFNLNHIVFVYMMPIMPQFVSVTWRMSKLCENGSNIDYLCETSSVLRKATETEISGLTFWLWFGSGF